MFQVTNITHKCVKLKTDCVLSTAVLHGGLKYLAASKHQHCQDGRAV